MLRIKSIKLSTVYRAILGMSIVCSSAFAQGLNSGPTPPPTPGCALAGYLRKRRTR